MRRHTQPDGRCRGTTRSPDIRRPAHARAYAAPRYRHIRPAGRLLPAYGACPGIRAIGNPRPTRQTRLHPPRPARTPDTRPMPRHAYGHNTCGNHKQQPWFPYVREAPNFEYRGQKLYRMFDSSVIRTSSVTRRTTRVTEIGTFY